MTGTKVSRCSSDSDSFFETVLKTNKNRVIDRSLLTRKQHETLLAIPRPIPLPPPMPKRKVKRCKIPKICPPRIDQLAVPTPIYTKGVLQSYHCVLEPIRVVRLVKLVHQDMNQRPKYTKKKVKKLSKKKLKKIKQEECYKIWLKKRISITTKAIVNYVKRHENEVTPNYRQLLVALGIMRNLKIKKKKLTMKYTKQYLMRICEVLAIAVDAECQPYRRPLEPIAAPPSEASVPEDRKHVYWIIREPPSDETDLEEEEEEEAKVTKEEEEEEEAEAEAEEEEGEEEGEVEPEEEVEGEVEGLEEEGAHIPGLPPYLEEGEGFVSDVTGDLSLIREVVEEESLAAGALGGDTDVEGDVFGLEGVGAEEGVIPEEPAPGEDGMVSAADALADSFPPGEETDAAAALGEEGEEGEGEEMFEGGAPGAEGAAPGQAGAGAIPVGEGEAPIEGGTEAGLTPGAEAGLAPGAGAGLPPGAAAALEEEMLREGEDEYYPGYYPELAGEEEWMYEEGAEEEIPTEPGEVPTTGAGVPIIASKPTIKSFKSLRSEPSKYDEEQEIPEGTATVDVHPPNTVSYLSWKVYLSWLEEFGNNIQNYGKCLRGFREIIEAKNQNYTDKIQTILVNWGTYLKDSMDFEKRMSDYFKGKTITKCPKCGDYTLYNIPADHEIPPELKSAAASTAKWTKLLEEASRICKSFYTDDVSTFSHETIEITDPTTIESSETSMYIFEDLNYDKS